MARKDDDFVLVSEKKSSAGKYLAIIAIIAVMAVIGIGGYIYIGVKLGGSANPSAPVASSAGQTNPPIQPRAAKSTTAPLKTVIYFAYDSSAISATDNETLQTFWLKIKGHQGEIAVKGYADVDGTPEYNKSLSDLRAKQTVTALRQLGLDNKYKVAAQGLGADNPVASNDSEDGRAKNRRVELTFTATK